MKNKKRKTLILGAALALTLLMPVGALAQITWSPVQDMFGVDQDGMLNKNRDGGSGGAVGNQGFGQEPLTPLGSGVGMLIAAGAGYALLKKKSNK